MAISIGKSSGLPFCQLIGKTKENAAIAFAWLSMARSRDNGDLLRAPQTKLKPWSEKLLSSYMHDEENTDSFCLLYSLCSLL